MTIQETIALEMKKIDEARTALMEHPKIRPFVRSVGKWVQETQGREISLYEQRNIAQCLYNAIVECGVRQNSKIFEATTEDSVSFLGVQLPVISALIPTLVLNEVSIVQAIDRRIAAVFYLDVKYGSTKGEVTSGGTMISATTGHATSKSERQYAIARTVRETVGTGQGAKSGTVDQAPGLINLENVKVEAKTGSTYTTIGTCTAAGVISGDGITGNGSITAAGVYSFTVSAAYSGQTILLTYDYQYDLPKDAYDNRDGVPEVDVTVTQSSVEAIDFPLRARWSLGAAIDMQKAHGIDLESELVKFLGGEVKFTIDQMGLDLIDEAAEGDDAATQVSDWDARPSEGEAWVFKKLEFLDRIYEGSNAIFEKTKRATANFMVCGNNVARVIMQLGKDYFSPVANLGKLTPTGPVKIGTLNNTVTVIQNPFKSTNRYTLGFRGPDYLHAGFIYCPYIPLFATPTLTTSDLMSQKGFLSSAAFKVINAGMFTYGDITNLQSGYQCGS